MLLIASMVMSAAPVRFVFHYCGGELMEVSSNDPIDPCCPQDKDRSTSPEIDNGCCQFEIASFNGHDSPVLTQALQSGVFFIADVPSSDIVIPRFAEKDFPLAVAHSPPHPDGRTICIEQQRFLI